MGKEQLAIQYAWANFKDFAHTQMTEIQKLMTSLAYLNHLDKSPYAYLVAPIQWIDIIHIFTREFCSIIGLAQETYLYTCITSGCTALPTLLKMSSVMQGKKDWVATDQLSVEIELDKDCQFHSIFACPVSRDTATKDNPPMILPCGHVLACESIKKLTKGSNITRFKCPYCPSEQTIMQVKEIHF